jgi:hypothetical protein
MTTEDTRLELLQGTLDLLIIETNRWERLVGAIARLLQPVSQE